MDSLRLIDGKMLRSGRTTGSCAAAAAKAAARMLLTQSPCYSASILTPKGIVLTMDISDIRINADHASCAVQKDSGDDPDVTNGAFIYADVSKTAEGISISGGEGVGRVTKPGLDQPVGEWAINTVPRRMIRAECEAVRRELGYEGGLHVTVSVPGGAELAERTFNPRLGIVGGISILGTSGIVEPRSEAAIVQTIRAELSQLYAVGVREVLLTIGNYGEDFAHGNLGLTLSGVNCSNFIGDTLAMAAETGFTRAVLVGHIGKLCKLGIGIMNTHSNHGDGRMETLAACALEAGAGLGLLRDIMACVSADAVISSLKQVGLFDGTIAALRRRVESTVARHIAGNMDVSVICFSGLGEGMEEVFRI